MSFSRVFFMTVIFAVFATGVAIAAPSTPATPNASKPNICSVTINSTDEIDVFKASIGEANANFIELTDLPEEDVLTPDRSSQTSEQDLTEETWLRKACKRKIRCDVLLISGHFGGSFFGSSGKTLTMEELEANSCDTSCDGILQKPKEVYLFGCNTLAGKKVDHRSPEEYRRVLIADGFTNEQAEQVVAFRYSPLGDAFGDRMRRVFRGAPRIYGFDSVGPSGKNVKPLLRNYFTAIKGRNYYSQANLQKLDEATNGEFAKALRVTALTQAAGAKELQREQIPVCYLNNPKVPFYYKLNWVVSNLNSDKSFSYLPAINDWLTRLTVENYDWKDKEFEVLERVITNTKLRDSLSAIVAKRDSAILGMQMKLLTFMKFFGWVLPNDYVKRVENLLIGDLNQDFDLERKDQICSHASSNSIKVNLPGESIPAARWRDPEFIDTLNCVASFNEDLMEKSIQHLMAAPDKTPLKKSLLQFVLSIKTPDNAAQRYYQTMFPNGDRGLTEVQREVLCRPVFYTGRPVFWAVPSLNPEFVHDATYVQQSGCYIKMTPSIFAEYMRLAKVSVPLRDAVIGALTINRARTTDFSLEETWQNSLMDLMETLPVEKQKDLGTIWSGMKNISVPVQVRMNQMLSRQSAEPLSDAGQVMENLLAEALPAASYCDSALKRSQTTLSAGHWSHAMFVLENVAVRCQRAQDEYRLSKEHLEIIKPLLVRMLNLMAPSSAEILELEFERTGVRPFELMNLLVSSKTQLTNINQLRAALQMNQHTYQGRMGTSSNDREISELFEIKALAQAVTTEWKSGQKARKDFAIRLLGARDLEDATLVQEVLKSFRAVAKDSADRGALMAALGKQDAELAANVWLELLAKASKSEADQFSLVYPDVYDMSTSTVFSQLKAGLRTKKLNEDLAVRVLVLMSRYTSGSFEKAKSQVQKFAQEFSTPKITAAARAAITTINTSEEECREFPRGCSSESAG